jgi:hypothetical protein
LSVVVVTFSFVAGAAEAVGACDGVGAATEWEGAADALGASVAAVSVAAGSGAGGSVSEEQAIPGKAAASAMRNVTD